MNQQLPLNFPWREGVSFDDFLTGENQGLVLTLRASVSTDAARDQFVYVWGKTGAGKSHLLQAVCQWAADNHMAAAYLPLAELAEYGPSMLEGMENLAVVCVDDLQCIAGNAQWEEALFHFYNRLRDSGTVLVAAAEASPQGLAIQLPDLRTRLGWGPVFQVAELTEAEKIRAMQQRAQQRGFDLPNEVAEFLLRRHARDMASLFALLDRLDEASMAQHRKLTIPFVRGLI
jgi:DnaA family protein